MNLWRTPKGFYNYFYLGNSFKANQERREAQWRKQKEKEINQNYPIYEQEKDKRLTELEAQMLEKSTLIDELNKALYQQPSEEKIGEIREKIQTLRKELEYLWYQQTLIEEHAMQPIELTSGLCA